MNKSEQLKSTTSTESELNSKCLPNTKNYLKNITYIIKTIIHIIQIVNKTTTNAPSQKF